MARPVMIVAPERLTPGIIARHWISPTPTTVISGISATPTMWPGLTAFSIARIAMPPRMNAIATTNALPSSASISLISRKPRMAEGRKATRMLRTNRHDIGFALIMPSSTAQKVRQ